MTTNFEPRPLSTLLEAAAAAHADLGLRYRPEVIRSGAAAFSIAGSAPGRAVILGEGAFWVVCLADAQRLDAAGYERAPRP